MARRLRAEESSCIVTGAGSGIGRALAAEFAANGARVVVGDIDATAAHETAERIRQHGHVATSVQADASSTSDISMLIDLARNRFGSVDAYVANAGVLGPPGLGRGDSDWEQALAVNVCAHVRAAALLIPDWLRRGGGYFVSIASAAGLLTHLGGAAYATTKHAAVGFAEWLAITYGDQGIGVSCVCPMGVDTPLLRTTSQSSDPAEQLAARSILSAAPVMSAEQVAKTTLNACRQGRFMVLPHPQVQERFRDKSRGHDRWIEAMRRYQTSLKPKTSD
ncbi:SDR family oxidoreductase [Mycobacterium sp. NPDC048908]|uniref:SDR family oxidoreductase n=1 Tax=Mycobacterium sp. NPDC048908 TaxID=3364292 RepID=UPI00371D982F